MKTFSIQYKKLLTNFILQKNQQKINLLSEKELSYSNTLQKDLLSYYNKYIPYRLNYFLIRSFPQKDLSSILKIECPTVFSSEEENFNKKNKEIINISKKLRRAFKIDEKTTCFSCSKKGICGFFEKEYKSSNESNENKDSKDSINNIYDVYISELHFYIHILHLITISSISSSSSTSLSDTININFKATDELKIDNNNSQLEISYENIINKFSFNKIPSDTTFQSAKIITENIYYLLDDIINQNGVYIKTLENEYISKRNYYKPEDTKKTKDKSENKTNEKSQEFDESILIENDPRKVLKLFNSSKNRKEKKILLAKFQKAMSNVNIQWGKYEKIDKLKTNKIYTINDIEEENEAMRKGKINEEKNPNSYNETSSNKKTNIKYQNTFIPNKSSIERTKSHPELFSIQKINKQVNLNNQLKITFEREANLKKLSSQSSPDDSFSLVKLPGKEIKMTLDYVRKIHPEGEDVYKNNIHMLINEKSVNLSEEVRKNRSKKERKIDNVQKMTIEKVEKEVEKVNSEIVSFEKRIEKENEKGILYINGDGDVNKNNDNKTITSSMDNNIEKALSNFERKLISEVDENSNNNININKYELVSSKDNIEVLKQKQVNNKTQLNNLKQKVVEIKTEFNQERINQYKANNYYQSIDEGHFQYEKDLDVMRSLKYMKDIKKYKKI